MRYPKEHNHQARHNLLKRGGSYAKKHGFSGSGVQVLAAAAQVTTGSLYKHFSSKDEFFAELVRKELDITAQMYEGLAGASAQQAQDAMANYLSLQHVKHPEKGCPLPALTPEIARADKSVRAAFQEGIVSLHQKLTGVTRDSDKAWALIAQNVGAVMLARAMKDESNQAELLAATLRVGLSHIA